MTHEELAARIERAEGPDRALDAEIAAALKIGADLPSWAASWKGVWRPHRMGYVDLMHDNGTPGPSFKALAYTGSLDAAMQLVPEGWSVGIGHLPGASWKIRAHLRDHRPQSLTKEGWSHIWVEGHHSTFACSLAAAAIRARSAS